jgi:hypothetical protein
MEMGNQRNPGKKYKNVTVMWVLCCGERAASRKPRFPQTDSFRLVQTSLLEAGWIVSTNPQLADAARGLGFVRE